jgi:hypothetical protein
MIPPVTIGDRVRISGEDRSPVLTVEVLYLEGKGETLTAACSWKKGAQLVCYPASSLIRDGK